MEVDQIEDSDESAGNRVRSYLFCLIAVCAILTLAYFVFHYLSVNSNGGNFSSKIVNWEYTSKYKKGNIGALDTDWSVADDENLIDVPNGDDYVLLKTVILPTKKYDTLCVRSANAVMTVKKDNAVIYDSLEGRNLFSSNQITLIPLGELDKKVNIEILLYSPLLFDFSAYLTTEAFAMSAASPIPYVDIILAALFIIIGILMLMDMFLSLVKQEKKFVNICFLGVLCILCGLSILANPIFTFFNFKSSGVMFKLAMASNVLIPGFVFMTVTNEKIKWNRTIESVVGINVLYAICMVLAPYDILFLFMLKMCFALQLINIFNFFYILKKHEIILEKNVTIAYMCFMITNTIYWFAILRRYSFDARIPMLIFTFSYAAVSYFEWTNLNKANAKENEIFEHDEFNISDNVCELKKNVYSYKDIDPDTIKDEIGKAAKFINLCDFKPDEKSGLVFKNFDKEFQFKDDLRSLLFEKCGDETNHAMHVAEYTYAICLKMGMSDERAMTVAKASLLHDIGKIFVPADTLLKSDALSKEEFNEIRCHAMYGYNILNGYNDEFMNLISEIAKEHHERFDGSGYFGIKGTDINFYARIVAATDVFDAVTTKRNYKKPWPFAKAFSYIIEHSGDFFDPEVVDAFSRAYNDLFRIYNEYKTENEKIQQRR